MSILKTTLLLCLLIGSLPYSIKAQIMQVDPALATAVKYAGDKESKALDGIKQEQSKINKLQAAANIQLEKIQKLQNKAYEYLSNASALVQNAYDIKKCSELSLKITEICRDIKKAVKKNPQGLITTAVATKHLNGVATEVIETYNYIGNIALNKKTLLNAAERLQITYHVRHRLTNIYVRLYDLLLRIKSYKFADIPRLAMPDLYYMTQHKMSIANRIIRDIQQMTQ